MSGHYRWRDLFRRTPIVAPWEGMRAFEFTGVFYAADSDEESRIFEAIADVVCPNGGTVFATLAKDEDGAGDPE